MIVVKRGETARVRKELDGATVVLLEALLDLSRLLVGVNVEWQSLTRRVSSDLLQPRTGARADGVGGDADRNPRLPKRLDLREVRSDGRLAHPFEATALVGDMEQHDLDARFGRRFRGRKCLGHPEVVELPDGRVSGGEHLAVDLGVVTSHGLRRRAARLLEHPVAPRPEVGSGSPAAQGALKCVAVAVDEAGESERGGHDSRR